MAISHTMSILNILTDLCVKRKSEKVKKHFCKYCLPCFISKNCLLEHKEVCLKTNGKQAVKLKNSSAKFKK